MGSALYLGEGHHHGHGHGDEGAMESNAASQVGLMVTLALFMHKAPEAAGYGTFILHKKLNTAERFAYVAAYAISSPLTAFLSFMVFYSKQ